MNSEIAGIAGGGQMTATFLHPEDADLAAMNLRAKSPLTSEGAEAWYRNDIPWLLQEIVFLRSEIASAREWFYADSASNPGDVSVTEAAYWWQQNVTGIWEKAQVRKLKDSISDLRAQIAALEADKDRLELGLNTEIVARQDAENSTAELREEYEAFRQRIAMETGLMTTRITELDDVIAQLRRELQAEREAGERNANLNQALTDQKVEHAREAIRAALAALD